MDSSERCQLVGTVRSIDDIVVENPGKGMQ